mmetsp:Transcript_1845/g.2674  ORF Transcript_1845/g.2674 Transcript_1845/m.2674 type:complete len:249 (+) Transcript_1845:450-1196(+)
MPQWFVMFICTTPPIINIDLSIEFIFQLSQINIRIVVSFEEVFKSSLPFQCILIHNIQKGLCLKRQYRLFAFVYLILINPDQISIIVILLFNILPRPCHNEINPLPIPGPSCPDGVTVYRTFSSSTRQNSHDNRTTSLFNSRQWRPKVNLTAGYGNHGRVGVVRYRLRLRCLGASYHIGSTICKRSRWIIWVGFGDFILKVFGPFSAVHKRVGYTGGTLDDGGKGRGLNSLCQFSSFLRISLFRFGSG